MTGDAQTEAEQIVLRLCWLCAGAAKPTSDDEERDLFDRLVAALAAAIDWTDVTAQRDCGIEEIVRVGDGIAEAVSALRARTGEQT